MCVVCFRVRCRRTLEADARPTEVCRVLLLDAARTYQRPARRDPLQGGLRAEFAALERLDTEIRERLAHELRHRDSRTRRGDRLFGGVSSGARLLRTLIEMVDKSAGKVPIMS